LRPTTSKLEGWVFAQMIKIIAVFIPAADRKDRRTNNAIERMHHPFLIALVKKQFGKAFDDPDTLLRQVNFEPKSFYLFQFG